MSRLPVSRVPVRCDRPVRRDAACTCPERRQARGLRDQGGPGHDLRLVGERRPTANVALAGRSADRAGLEQAAVHRPAVPGSSPGNDRELRRHRASGLHARLLRRASGWFDAGGRRLSEELLRLQEREENRGAGECGGRGFSGHPCPWPGLLPCRVPREDDRHGLEAVGSRYACRRHSRRGRPGESGARNPQARALLRGAEVPSGGDAPQGDESNRAE